MCVCVCVCVCVCLCIYVYLYTYMYTYICISNITPSTYVYYIYIYIYPGLGITRVFHNQNDETPWSKLVHIHEQSEFTYSADFVAAGHLLTREFASFFW